MADIYDISSIPARFAAEITRGAENATAAQNMVAGRATLPEEMPDYAGNLSAEYVPPDDTSYVMARVHQIIAEEAIIDALIERGRV